MPRRNDAIKRRTIKTGVQDFGIAGRGRVKEIVFLGTAACGADSDSGVDTFLVGIVKSILSP